MDGEQKSLAQADDLTRRIPAYLFLAFAIGGLVGAGLAATWIPEKRRHRLTTGIARRYRQLREAGGAALDDMRRASRDVASDFREEMAASLEAAREEFSDMASQQLGQLRKSVRREYKKLRR